MKKCIVVLMLLFSSLIHSQNQDVQRTIETFFEGFHAQDTLKIKSICSDKMFLQSIVEKGTQNTLTDETSSKFYLAIASIPNTMKFEERILKYSIQIDGAMAHAWTPYEFYVNSKLSHKGVNAFTLFKENGVWKIIYIIDTRRKDI